MKANRKFVEDGEAVSAVIGVILMVAITVAIAATVYVYVSGMLTPASAGKTISAIQVESDDSAHTATYKVTDADAGIDWDDVDVSIQTGTADHDQSGTIEVGDYFTITFSGAGTHVPDLIWDGSIIWTGPAVAV